MTGRQTRRGKSQLKARYDFLKEQGLCVTCGKEPAIKDQIRCTHCKKKREDSNRRSYLKRKKLTAMRKPLSQQLQKGEGTLDFRKPANLSPEK